MGQDDAPYGTMEGGSTRGRAVPRAGRGAGGDDPGRSFGGLRSRLLALVLLALALPVTVVSLLLDRQGADRIAAQEERLVEAARAFGRAEAMRTGRARAALEALAAMPAIAGAEPGCDMALAGVDAATAWSRGIAVARPDGRVVCASEPGLHAGDLSGTASFRLAIRAGGFVVSDLTAPAEGKRLGVAAVSPLVVGGRVVAVLVAGLDLDWTGRLAAEEAGHGGFDAAMLIDGEGRVLGAVPAPPGLVGSTVADTPLVATILSRGAGTGRGEMPDGVRRVIGFARLPGTDVTVVLGRDEAAVVAPVRRAAALSYGALLLAVVVAAVLAMWFGRAVLLRGLGAMAEAARDGRRVSEVPPDLGAAPEVWALHRALVGAEAARQATEARLTEALAHVEALAATDGLTGLFNRRHFDGALSREWRVAQRAGSSLSVVLLDADRFKLFNDRYGHPAGDACLRAVGAAMAAVSRRPHDQPARYGGEEFALLLPNTDETGARHVAERLRRLVEGAGIVHADNPGGWVTVSLGVATARPLPGDGRSDRLVEEADAALYRAKAGGRNRVEAASLEEGVEPLAG